MKKLCPPAVLLILFNWLPGIGAYSQCATANINWDHLDFLKQDPTYISASQAQTQYFALGTNKVTITHNYASAVASGENATNTGETGAYGTGEDVQFIGDGMITVAFQTPAQNIKFSLFDIDYNQKITITALNGATAQTITVARLSAAQLIIAGSGTTTASATGEATTAVADNSIDGTANVDITGPVTSFTLTITQTGTKTGGPAAGREDGSFWLSDISACITNTAFPTSYYAISQPYTGQPGYVLSALDNKVFLVNPANGVAKLLFTDPSGNNINSMGYDPYNRILYYTYSLTGSGSTPNPNDKSIQKYDITTGTISTVVSNVNTIGIPTYTSGVESGSAAFYNGALYIGIEGIDGDESKIWRIDFDGSFNPVAGARQVFAIATNDHDWGDFGISNGILYDFDGKSGGAFENVYHYNLQTGIIAATYSSAATMGFVPRQIAVDWTEKIYNTGTAASSSSGTITPYNGNGTINTAQQYTVTTPPTTPSGSWGDAAEAFRPMADFGDAPSTYDPVALSPALNERDTSIRLGATLDVEWSKTSSSLANADGSDEDGVGTPTIFNPALSTYNVQVAAYNNSGANATLMGWLDYNGNGIFDSNEASAAVSLPTSASQQTVYLNWTGISSTLATGTYTYLRIRLTSSAAMTSSNATGYYYNGETEDYRIFIDNVPLGVNLLSFEAKLNNNKRADLSWSSFEDLQFAGYELQKSTDKRTWATIYTIAAKHGTSLTTYQYTDPASITTATYYRLKLADYGSFAKYSAIRTVDYADFNTSVTITPNPAVLSAMMSIKNATPEAGVQIRITGITGSTLKEFKTNLGTGTNVITLPLESLQPGIYLVQFVSVQGTAVKKLIIR